MTPSSCMSIAFTAQKTTSATFNIIVDKWIICTHFKATTTTSLKFQQQQPKIQNAVAILGTSDKCNNSKDNVASVTKARRCACYA
eukprot:m.101234 g.101234  ORF g.101234 m.101234 type:complete len:85 (-) comp13736_c2_seq2:168-422(-)